jgi:hypothetical protein
MACFLANQLQRYCTLSRLVLYFPFPSVASNQWFELQSMHTRELQNFEFCGLHYIFTRKRNGHIVKQRNVLLSC